MTFDTLGTRLRELYLHCIFKMLPDDVVLREGENEDFLESWRRPFRVLPPSHEICPCERDRDHRDRVRAQADYAQTDSQLCHPSNG
jgi:hypothetical protein